MIFQAERGAGCLVRRPPVIRRVPCPGCVTVACIPPSLDGITRRQDGLPARGGGPSFDGRGAGRQAELARMQAVPGLMPVTMRNYDDQMDPPAAAATAAATAVVLSP